MSDLIKREDAIEAIDKMICDNKWVCECAINSLPSAEPQGELISKKDVVKAVTNYIWHLPNECYKNFNSYNDIEEVVTDAVKQLPSTNDNWIPVSERMPSELEAVNVTWVNHNPPVYYQYTKDVPNADTAVYYRGAWYWWDATVIDLLGEYGGAYIHGIEPIDKDVEVTAWMPLPKPYKGGDDDMTNEEKNAIEMQNTIIFLAPLIADMLTDDEELKEEFTAALLQTKVVSIGDCAYTVKQGGDTE